MCAACGVPTPVTILDTAETPESPGAAQPAKFAALRNPTCRVYLGGEALAMMADNVEHVITYWVIWQKFHSPALTGFEVISHWLPFLLLSPYFGALADRFECRQLIPGSQALFMVGSIRGIWVNIAFSLPLTVMRTRTRFTGHQRAGIVARQRVGVLGAVRVFR